MTVSFETGEQDSRKIYMPAKAKIRKMRGVVVKAIADTDNGTITLKNSVGSAMANGAITATASDALNVAYSVSPTTNNTVSADDFFQIVMAKTTAGGKVHLTIEFELVQ